MTKIRSSSYIPPRHVNLAPEMIADLRRRFPILNRDDAIRAIECIINALVEDMVRDAQMPAYGAAMEQLDQLAWLLRYTRGRLGRATTNDDDPVLEYVRLAIDRHLRGAEPKAHWTLGHAQEALVTIELAIESTRAELVKEVAGGESKARGTHGDTAIDAWIERLIGLYHVLGRRAQTHWVTSDDKNDPDDESASVENDGRASEFLDLVSALADAIRDHPLKPLTSFLPRGPGRQPRLLNAMRAKALGDRAHKINLRWQRGLNGRKGPKGIRTGRIKAEVKLYRPVIAKRLRECRHFMRVPVPARTLRPLPDHLVARPTVPPPPTEKKSLAAKRATIKARLQQMRRERKKD